MKRLPLFAQQPWVASSLVVPTVIIAGHGPVPPPVIADNAGSRSAWMTSPVLAEPVEWCQVSIAAPLVLTATRNPPSLVIWSVWAMLTGLAHVCPPSEETL